MEVAGYRRFSRCRPGAHRVGLRQQQQQERWLGRRRPPPARPPAAARRSPTSSIAYDTGIDYLDPGLSYTVEGWGIMWNVYLPLHRVQARRTAPTARRSCRTSRRICRQVSADGKTYTLDALKDGPQVLGRHADQGERLHGDDQARLQGRLAGRRLLRRTSSARTRSPRRRPVTSAASRPTTRPARSRSS